MQNFAHSKNKLGYAYVLTPKGLSQKAELTSSFLRRKMQEYEALKQEIHGLQAELTDKRDEVQSHCFIPAQAQTNESK